MIAVDAAIIAANRPHPIFVIRCCSLILSLRLASWRGYNGAPAERFRPRANGLRSRSVAVSARCDPGQICREAGTPAAKPR
jgi:hypothetical protein